jgi:hypothetical protein
MALETKDLILVTLSATALVISIFTFALNYGHMQRTAPLNRKPVLMFEYAGDRGWVLRNVGSGPALNIIVAQNRVRGEWFNPMRVPPLSKDGEVVLKWLGHVNTTGFGATYTDSENFAYTSMCGNDLSSVYEGMLFGPGEEAQIGWHWNHPPYQE